MNFSTMRQMRKISGYTLTEVVVAVLIVGITGISLYMALCSGFGIVGMTREKLRGTQILIRKLEAVRLCNWGELRSLTFTSSSSPAPVVTDSDNISYSGTITTNSAAGIVSGTTYKSDMRLVTVTVTWTNYSFGKAMVRTSQMQTLVARRGMQNYVWGNP